MTIVITTFKHRFEKYFKPLLSKINEIAPDSEIIVLVNGEHKENFDNDFRKNMLSLLSEYNNVFPIFFPQFRGLSKLWNTGLIHASSDDILMLNDDITIWDTNFFKNVYSTYRDRCYLPFKINNSWSHVMLNKREIEEHNLYFNEKLLGIGEEDGYFEWVYKERTGLNFESVTIDGIINHVDMSHNPTNTVTIPQGKYSKLNGELMLSTIFKLDENGKQIGMFPHKVILIDNSIQYPNEGFYRTHIKEL